MKLIEQLLEEDDNEAILEKLNKAYRDGDMKLAGKFATELGNALSRIKQQAPSLSSDLLDAVADAFRLVANHASVVRGMWVNVDFKSSQTESDSSVVSDEDHNNVESAVEKVKQQMEDKGVTFRYEISDVYRYKGKLGGLNSYRYDGSYPVIPVYISSIRQKI